MLLFVWSGRGYIVFLDMLLTVAMAGALFYILGIPEGDWHILVAELIIASILSVPLWMYGKKWNAISKEFVDKQTGEEMHVGKNSHRTFGIPMEYWAFIWPGILLLMIFSSF